MFFTRKGLEQATDEVVAAVKAARFPAGRLADLCCGIGGDAIALARHLVTRSVSEGLHAVDLDPSTAHLAAANLQAVNHCGTVTMGDAADFPVGDFAAWHIDPDRRSAGRRSTCVDLFTPSLATIDLLLTRNPNAAVKLAPAAIAPDSWARQAELCWLGSRGECRQQVAWFGSLAAHPGQRSAIVVDARGGPCTIVGMPSAEIDAAQRLGRFLYEPHAAVLAAGLAGSLAREHALAAVSAGVAYLTSDHVVDEPALDAFEVADVLPLDQKRLKAHCRQRGIGRLEVKKRGVDIDPEKLHKSVIGEGNGAATLLVSRVGRSVQAIFAQRVAFSPPS
jgi:SAM-dependent methyltransferase